MKNKLYCSVLLAVFILPSCNSYSVRNSGYSHFVEENYELALADCNRAIKINPKVYDVYFHRAEIYQQQKEYDLALADYSKAIELNPEIHYVYWQRAEIYKQQKEYDLALADYNKAIELNPTPNYYRGRGVIHYLKKEYDSAIKEYIKAIRLNSYPPAYNDLAWLLATCSDEKYRDASKAVAFAEKAAGFGKRAGYHIALEPQVLNTLAAAYAEAGDFDMAVKNQEKAIQLLKAEGDLEHLDEYKKRLESYKKDIPWRDII